MAVVIRDLSETASWHESSSTTPFVATTTDWQDNSNLSIADFIATRIRSGRSDSSEKAPSQGRTLFVFVLRR